MTISGILLSASWLQNVSRCKEAQLWLISCTSSEKCGPESSSPESSVENCGVSVLLGSLTIIITDCDHNKL